MPWIFVLMCGNSQSGDGSVSRSTNGGSLTAITADKPVRGEEEPADMADNEDAAGMPEAGIGVGQLEPARPRPETCAASGGMG